MGYYGPMPPRKYHFQVFALDTVLNLPNGLNRQALLYAILGHVEIVANRTLGMTK